MNYSRSYNHTSQNQEWTPTVFEGLASYPSMSDNKLLLCAHAHSLPWSATAQL